LPVGIASWWARRAATSWTRRAGRIASSPRSGDDTVDGGAGNDRVRGGHGDDALFGGDGKDRLRGGQDNDFLDGGDGDDYLNGGGDGRDKDRIVCGDGRDVVVLGRNDVVLVEVDASEHPADAPALDEPEPAADDGCEKVKGPGASEVCASHLSGCEGAGRPCVATARECGEVDRMPCASSYDGCEEPVQEPCVATLNRECDDPVGGEPEPDPPVEATEPDAGAE
jgi:hypothetical protein